MKFLYNYVADVDMQIQLQFEWYSLNDYAWIFLRLFT